MKWAALVRSEIQKQRNTIFSEYLKQQGIDNELTLSEIDEDNFKEQVELIMQDHKLIRISNSFGRKVLQYFDNQTPQVMTLGAADTIVKEGQLIYLRSAQYLCCLDIFKRRNFEVDVKKPGLVVGLGALARFALAALVQIGVRKIAVTGHADDQSDEFIRSFLKFNFDIEVEYMPKEKLLLESGNHSLVISALADNEETSQLYEELRYFNYLAQNPVVWDIVLTEKETRFVKEAKKLNYRTVDAVQFCAETDLVWLSWVQDHNLNLQDYEDHLRAKISQ